MTVLATRSGRALAAGCAIAIAASTASAAPTININLSVLGGSGGPQNFALNQATNATAIPGVFDGTGSQLDTSGFSEWSVGWTVTGDDAPSGVGSPDGARLGANFTIMNNRTDGALASDNHLIFSILVNMNLQPGFGGAVQYAANGGPTITVPAGQAFAGELASVGNNPWSSFLINGATQASLFPAPSQLGASSNPGGGSSTNSTSGTVGLSPLAVTPTSMGIRMDFDLTPGDRVTFAYNFFVIPAPGALAMLGLAGIVGNRRRRG